MDSPAVSMRRCPGLDKGTGRPRSCGLYAAAEIACMYLRQNGTQEFLGDMKGVSQPTVSRIVTVLVPVVRKGQKESL